MKWKDLLTTYWSQVVLFLLMIAYFVRRVFDGKSKKIEIIYSLFQQNRINAINQFFARYAKVESMWHNLPYWNIIEYKIKSDEVDNIIWPPINDLKQSVFELRMYFQNEDHKHFDMIFENILSINSNLLKNRHDHSNQNILQRTNDFTFFKDKALKENSKRIDDLTSTIRESFNYK